MHKGRKPGCVMRPDREPRTQLLGFYVAESFRDAVDEWVTKDNAVSRSDWIRRVIAMYIDEGSANA